MSGELEETKEYFAKNIESYTSCSLVSIMMANDLEKCKESKFTTAEDREFARYIYNECVKELRIRKIIKG